MPIFSGTAYKLRMHHADHRRKAETYGAQVRAIATDPHYTDTERARAKAPLWKASTEDFATRKRESDALATGAIARMMKSTPLARQARAAVSRPDRVAPLMAILPQLSLTAIREFAKVAIEDKDLATAFAITQGLDSHPGVTLEQGAAIRAELAAIGHEDYEAALADAVGSLEEMSAFILAGPLGDGTGDALEAAKYANAARSLPDGNGGTIALSDAEVARLRTLAVGED